jgi:hypothetical protein
MKRIIAIAVLVVAAFSLPGGFHEWTPPAHATVTTQQPDKVAVIIAENQDWNGVIGAANAPYLNGLIGATKGGLSIDPSPSNCNYPTADGAGTTGTVACTAGMFQSFRKGTTAKLTSGSAPEYAWLSMGSDANIRDGTFPCGVWADPNTTCTAGTFTATNPEKGIAGYEPGHFDITPPTSYDVFDITNADSYAEDYLGSSSACDISKWSDTSHNFYARKHNTLLLSWNQSPDGFPAYTKSSVQYSPSSSPTDAYCKAHMLDFPNNTPNATTEVAANFAGTETFGKVTMIQPSMCHMGHNGITACRGGTTGCVTLGACGGVPAFDRWLSMNLPAIQKDVGQNGVVVITYDEDANADGNGFAPPVPTIIVPGTNSSGVAGTLHAGSGSYTAGTFDQSSTLRALLEAAGSSCSALDNNAVYNNAAAGTLTARGYCNAATPLPLTVDVASSGPAIVQQATSHTTTNSASATGTWPAATTTGDFLVAAVGYSGAPTSITPPTGWVLAKDKTKNVSLYVCANCASQSGAQTWTANAAFANVVILEEWSGIASGATIDQTANNTSGSTSVTLADSGTTAATTTANEIVLAELYNGAHSTFTGATSGYNVVQDGQTTGSGIQIALLTQIISATGTQNASASYATADRMRGAIATYTR